MKISQLFTNENGQDPNTAHSNLYIVEKDGKVSYVREDFCEGYSTGKSDIEPCKVFHVLTPQEVAVNPELRIFLETGEMNVKIRG